MVFEIEGKQVDKVAKDLVKSMKPKTETEIAKQLSETYKKEKEEAFRFYYCEIHKQTCQRWLEKKREELKFLVYLEKRMEKYLPLLFGIVVRRRAKVLKDIANLNQTIKLYEDVKV